MIIADTLKNRLICVMVAGTNVVVSRESVVKAFSDYISKYNPQAPKIKLGVDHAYRVADLAETMAKDIKAGEDMAWLCGMLHDIGRFEQVKRYNTFSYALSVNHALFGADILFTYGLIKEVCPDLSEDDMRILEKAIRNHSAYRIEPGLSREEMIYSNILRDADKIDIFWVNCDTPMEDIYNVTTDELRVSSAAKRSRSASGTGQQS